MPGVMASSIPSQGLVGSPEVGRATTGTLKHQIYCSVCMAVSPASEKEVATPPIEDVAPQRREGTVG